MANKDIDQRIVEMQFDAKDFDKGIKQSTKNLSEFKKELNFDDAIKQMGDVVGQSAPMNKSLADMAKNVARLAKEFTGIGDISTFVAQKIKHAWQDAANGMERFVKSMTTDQIREGSGKYDRLLKSVQTITNATGESEETVYKIMSDLNDYTDQTSYDFASMSENIGKFTTAGLGLKESEEAMEGIANWAALAGQNATTATRAMYNVSQAISADAMQMLDWKSIQNAGMDARWFRQEALDAAVAAGTLKKTADGLYKTVKGGKQVTLDNFTETLKYKWFDKKTMMTVFKTFGDNTQGIGEKAYKAAQRCTTFNDALGAWKDMLSTGWMQSYEHVFGKLSEAMDLFSGICEKVSDELAKFMDLRNGILEHWKAAGGRDSLWGALVGELKTPDGETLFEGAYGLLDMVNDLADSFHEAITNFLLLFMNPLNATEYKNDPKKLWASVGAALQMATDKVREFTTSIRDFLHGTAEGSKQSRLDQITSIVEGLLSAFHLVWQVVKGVFQFAGAIAAQLKPTWDAIMGLLSSLFQALTEDTLKSAKENTIGKFFLSLAEILRPFTTVINVVVRVVAGLIGAIVDFARKTKVFELIGAAFKILFNVIAVGVAKFLDSGILQQIFAWIAKGIAKIPGLITKILTVAKAIYNSGIFQMVFAWIGKALSKIPELISKIRALASTFVSSAKSNKKLQTFWSSIKDIFSAKNLKSLLVNIKNWVKNLIKQIPTIFSAAGGGVGSFFSGLFDGFLGLFVGSAKADEATEEIAESIAQPIIALVTDGGAENALSQATEKVKPSILTMMKNKIGEIWTAITDFFRTLANSEALQSVKQFFSGTTFTGLLSSAKELMKWFSLFKLGSGIGKMGKGIGQIGKGFKLFSKNMKHLNLSNIFSNMFNISNIINSNNDSHDISKSFDFSNIGPQILEIAAAVGVLVLAAKEIIAMKPEELKQAGLSIAALMGGLLAAGIIAKHFAGNGMSFLGLAAGLWLIIQPLKMLGNMPLLSTSEGPGLLKMIGKLALVMFALALAIDLAGSAKNKGFVSMAVGLNLLLIPLQVLSKMALVTKDAGGNYTGGLIQAVMALGVLMVAMAGAARLANGGAKGFFALSVALNLLMIPVKSLAAMDYEHIAKGVGFLEIIILSLGGLMYVAQQGEANKLGGLVAAITALAAVGWLIGHTMDWTQAAVGFVPIILLIGSMALMFKAASKLNEKQISSLKAIFISFTVMVGVLALSLVALKALDVSESMILEFFGGIILTVLSMSLLVKQASKLDSKGLGKVALVVGVLGGLVLAMAGSLAIISSTGLDWQTIAAFMAGVVGVIAVAGIFLPALSKLDFTGVLIAAAGLGLAVVAITGALSLMAPVLLGSIGSSLQTISERLKTTSGLLKDFFDRMETITDASIEHTKAVFTKIGEMIVDLAVIATFSDQISAVMTELSRLGNGLDLFFLNEAKYPTPESSKSFMALQKLIDIGPSLSTFTIGNLATELVYLGAGLGLFHSATADITTAEPMALALLQGIFGQADNIEKFTQLPLDTFTSQMSGLGGAMSLYAKGAKEVTGLGEGEDVDVSKSVGILKAVCNAISGDDGKGEFKIPENMPDSAAMGLFAGQLESLGNALSTFAKAAHEMETDTTNAIALLKFLAEIGGYVTPENLKVTKVFDDAGVSSGSDGKSGTLGQFSLDIKALGTALSDFAKNIGGNESQFTTGLGVLTKFKDLNRELTVGNIAFASVFYNARIHKSSLESFGEDISALGRGLASFASSVEMDNGKTADFDHAIEALNFITVLKARLPKTGGLKQLVEGTKQGLDDAGNEMQGLGQSLKDFSDKISGVGADGKGLNYDGMLNALEVLQKMVGIVTAMSVLNPDTGNIYGAGYFVNTLNEIMKGLVNPETIGLVNDGTSVAEKIAAFATEVSNAFEGKKINEMAVAAFADIARGLHDISSLDPSFDFEYPGKMISVGLAQGIRNGESEVVKAVVDVVKAGIVAGNETADSHSPSRVFESLGRFMDLGLVEGLYGSQDQVEDASTSMVGSAIEQAGIMLGAVSKALADNLDLQPTITPVLDLSQVTAAGSTLSTLFDGYGLSLTNALERAAAATGSSGPIGVTIQNPTDLSGIQSSIAALQTEVTNLQAAIGNMKIVLNTGVVAGGVTDDIDLNLGRKSLYASRRN